MRNPAIRRTVHIPDRYAFILLRIRLFTITLVIPMDEQQRGGQLFTYEEPASRLELFIRFVYSFLISIVLAIYGFVAGICMMVQWLHILILGRRNSGLHDVIQGYLEYQVHVMAYLNIVTDRRPNIMPEKVDIFEQPK